MWDTLSEAFLASLLVGYSLIVIALIVWPIRRSSGRNATAGSGKSLATRPTQTPQPMPAPPEEPDGIRENAIVGQDARTPMRESSERPVPAGVLEAQDQCGPESGLERRV